MAGTADKGGSRGWSVRVVSSEDARASVRWYIVAETDPEAAVVALRRAFDVGNARVEAVQRVPSLFQGRRLRPGEVAYLYRRGTSRP